jgi:hypothetical protein
MVVNPAKVTVNSFLRNDTQRTISFPEYAVFEQVKI